jgi:hypothetical protein
MKVLYIAGPYRGKDGWVEEQNIRRAEEVALEVWAMGFVALCSHTMTRFYRDALPIDTWMRGDLELLSRCDGLLALRDWRKSVGATIEVRYAEQYHIPVFYSLAEVEEVWRTEGGPARANLPSPD